MADEPDNPVDSESLNLNEEDKLKTAAGTGAAGLGCLGMLTLPWSIMALVIGIIIIAAVIGKLFLHH